jgi:hypothetical protein
MRAAGTRKCATPGPSGGAEALTVHAIGLAQAGQVVATSTDGSACTRCGIANASHAHPPHQSVRAPMTENPKLRVANGWASTIRPSSSSTRWCAAANAA